MCISNDKNSITTMVIAIQELLHYFKTTMQPGVKLSALTFGI